jgi:hypothetical protein
MPRLTPQQIERELMNLDEFVTSINATIEAGQEPSPRIVDTALELQREIERDMDYFEDIKNERDENKTR